MSIFVIPLQNIPQTFGIALTGTNYTMTCRWNDSPEGGWALDITNADTNETLAVNIPLITGADCLSGLEYLGIRGRMIIYTDGDETAVPTYTNLGVESNLYFVTEVPNG